jgi:hypothetical protein
MAAPMPFSRPEPVKMAVLPARERGLSVPLRSGSGIRIEVTWNVLNLLQRDDGLKTIRPPTPHTFIFFEHRLLV